MEKINIKLNNLHLEYSPQKKIELMLKACKLIYDSMSVSSPGPTVFNPLTYCSNVVAFWDSQHHLTFTIQTAVIMLKSQPMPTPFLWACLVRPNIILNEGKSDAGLSCNCL